MVADGIYRAAIGRIALVDGYHGDTLGAMSVGFSEPFHRFYTPLLPVTRVPARTA